MYIVQWAYKDSFTLQQQLNISLKSWYSTLEVEEKDVKGDLYFFPHEGEISKY